MNETYVECMIKRKPNPVMKLLKYVTIMLAAFCMLIGLTLPGMLITLLIGIVLAAAAYFINLNSDIEYEYLYVDRQLTVDKILNQARRKKIAQYDLNRMEILAPIKSYRLDSYKNRTAKVIDFSSGMDLKPDPRYLMYIDGNQKIIFEPSPEMVKAIAAIAPRKVFKD